MALVRSVFFDTSVLVAGIVGFEQDPQAAQHLMDAVVDGRIQRPLTAWHCCLEFFAVVTRVPLEFRLSSKDACKLVEEEILARFKVHQLRPAEIEEFFPSAHEEQVTGARIYDSHLAAVARAAGAAMIVTDNPRHFRSSAGQLRVLTSEGAVAELEGIE